MNFILTRQVVLITIGLGFSRGSRKEVREVGGRAGLAHGLGELSGSLAILAIHFFHDVIFRSHEKRDIVDVTHFIRKKLG